MKFAPYNTASPAHLLVLGVPFDGGTTMKAGARMGPAAIRQASAGLYPCNRERKQLLHQVYAVQDGGDVAVVPMSVDKTYTAIKSHLNTFPSSSKVLFLGGDHSIVLPHLRWLHHHLGPLALIHLDAHHDLWDDFWDDRYNHATVFRRALEEGLIDASHTIQVGLRGSLDSSEEDQYGDGLGLRQITTGEWYSKGSEWVSQAIHQRLQGAKAIYISIDIDVVDPAFAPGTGTPEAGGPNSFMVLSLLRQLHFPIAGGDVVELAPDLDPTGTSSLFAATLAQELLFLMSYD